MFRLWLSDWHPVLSKVNQENEISKCKALLTLMARCWNFCPVGNAKGDVINLHIIFSQYSQYECLSKMDKRKAPFGALLLMCIENLRNNVLFDSTHQCF